MVRIRLTRAGAKKAPFYRIVVTDHRSPRDGRFLESIGTFDPLRQPPVFQMKRDRFDYWTSKGAQLSDTVASVIRKHGKAEAAPVAS